MINIIIGAMLFIAGFALSALFSVDSYQKGYEDGLRNGQQIANKNYMEMMNNDTSK